LAPDPVWRTNALRSIEFHGGLDAFLMRARASDLDLKVVRLKKLIAAKKAEATEATA
jgi:large subunit ribosomal protein L28